MKILTCCITFPEEWDILPNMILQAKKLGDVWLFDGGRINAHFLAHNVSINVSEYVIRDMAERFDCMYSFMPWPGQPGTQRNRALELVDGGYDWIVQMDSDELWSDQAAEQLHQYLGDLKPVVSNVAVKMLHLVEDERHYWHKNFTHLVHGRIFRPGTVKYSESWHEHQTFSGQRVQSDLVMLHTKHLFVDRLIRFYGRGLDMWPDMDCTPLPPDRFGLTWPELKYPR